MKKKDLKKIKVKLDTSPLVTAHKTRGIGFYTRFLRDALAKRGDVELVTKEQEAEIIHYPFFDLFFNTLPLKPNKKIVVTIHDVIPLVFPKNYKPGVKGSLRLLAQIGKLRFVKAVITDSKNSKKDILNYLKVPFEKVYPIYLAPNPEIKPADAQLKAKVKRKFALPKKYLLYVGDINYNKNIPFLIKSLKYLPYEFKLVLVGKNFVPQDIPEWQAIEKQLALSDVKKRVKFLTTVDSSSELAAIYSQALVYVNPSLYEGFGLPVLEAMRAKTPVISLKNSSIPEIAGDKIIYLEKENPEELAELIEALDRWPKTKRMRWVSSAYKHSLKFSWEKTAAETVRVYQTIIHH